MSRGVGLKRSLEYHPAFSPTPVGFGVVAERSRPWALLSQNIGNSAICQMTTTGPQRHVLTKSPSTSTPHRHLPMAPKTPPVMTAAVAGARARRSETIPTRHPQTGPTSSAKPLGCAPSPPHRRRRRAATCGRSSRESSGCASGWTRSSTPALSTRSAPCRAR